MTRSSSADSNGRNHMRRALVRVFFVAMACLVMAKPAEAQVPTETRLLASPNRLQLGGETSLHASVWSDVGQPFGRVRFRRSGSPDPLGIAELRPVLPGGSPINAGINHTCIISIGGGILCWGYDHHAFGNGDSGIRRTPVPSSRLPEPMVQVSTHWSHSCGVSQAGAALCWGSRGNGVIGDGRSEYLRAARPVRVPGLESGVVQVSVGQRHSCALTEGGAVYCWGSNAWGIVGDGTYEPRSTAVPVTGLSSGVVQIAAGELHTCALRNNGEVWCWGMNGHGQLGNGVASFASPVPLRVLGSARAAEISAGTRHACLLTEDGHVQCWGANEAGQLGIGSYDHTYLPTDVVDLEQVVALASSGNASRSCAIRLDGTMMCWGDNIDGALGTGTPGWDSPVPVLVQMRPGERIWTASTGWSHTCAVLYSGEVRCWGSNQVGQIGNGLEEDSYVPVAPSGSPLSWPRARAIASVTGGGELSRGRHRLRALFERTRGYRTSRSAAVTIRVR